MNKTTIILISALLSIFLPVFAQDDPLDDIIKAIQASDSRQLSTYFNSTVNLRLNGTDNSYSQSQGEMVMKNFFKKAPAHSFILLQRGATDNTTQFAIGDYLSGGKLYQVYIQLRLSNGKYIIHELRFEEKKSATPVDNDN